jgi:hypothetical protein
MNTSKLIRILVAGLLAVGASFVLASPASASTSCPANGAAYPPASCSIALSATTVVVGDQVTVTGRGFGSGESVTGTVLPSMALGTKPADATGTVSFTFSTAALDLGAHRVELRGTSGIFCSADFTVVAAGQGSGLPAGTQTGSAAGTGSTGALAFTGSNAIIPMSIIGAVLIAAGGTAVVVTRRRRSIPTDY